MLLSCLRRICQGSTNVSLSFQRSVCCVQERVQNASCIFSFKWCRKNASFKIRYLPLQWKLMQFWNLLIDRQGLVKNLKTWWKLGENLMNFQNRVKTLKKILVNFQNLVNPWWYPKRGENLVNFKTWWKRWWMWKPGEFSGVHQTNGRSVLRTEGFWNACCIHVCCLPKITNKQLNISCWLCANLHTMSCSRPRLDTNSRAKRVASAPLPNQTARLSRCCGKRVIFPS